jgi:hypothetical protein
MKRTELDENDELQEEYDLKSMHVRKLGPERKSFAGTIRSEPDAKDGLPETDSAGDTSAKAAADERE